MRALFRSTAALMGVAAALAVSAAGATNPPHGHYVKDIIGELELAFQGASNAGRPMVLEGGLDWKPLSLTPKDMDFLQAKHTAAREIALAFGVPPMLLGIPGDNTYSNYQEANRAFWRHTVLPLASRLGAALTQWLAPAFGGALRLEVDGDRVDALASDRAALWQRVTDAPFLTLNEKREMTGFAPVEGGDRLW